MKKARMNRVLSALLALVMCIGMVPATVTLASGTVKEVFKDDFSAYFEGEDTFWQNTNYTAFQSKYHNTAGSDNYATYGIVSEDGNKMLELVPFNQTYNHFETRDKISGERGFTVDVKFPTPLGESVPGLIFNLFVDQSFPRGYALFYMDALGDTKIYETTGGSLNQIKLGLRPKYDTWYTVKAWLSKGELMLKVWPRDKAEPADTATPDDGVVVLNSSVFDDGFLSGSSRIYIQSRARDRAGEAYPVLLDNLTVYGTPVGNTPGVIAPKLSLADASVGKGGTQLVPVLTGMQLDNPTYSWTSSDPSVVSVKDGVAYAMKSGSATVTVNLLNTDGTVAASARATVTSVATGIDPTNLAKQYEVGQTVTLKLNEATQGVKWASSDLSVADVDANGTVTCKARGTVKITASWTKGGEAFSDTAAIQVGAPVKTLKILTIGDDYSIDTAYYLKKLDRLYPDVNFEFAVLHISGITLQSHARNAWDNKAAYALYTPDPNGNLVKSRDNVRISEMLSGEDWDIVSLGSQSFLAGYDTAYRTDMQYLLDYLRDNEPGALLWWPVAWSFADGYTPYSTGVTLAGAYADYWKNSKWMYNAIVRCTNTHILNNSDSFDFVVPTGVAVQNLRATLGRDLTRDSDHLTNKTGRLTAGVTLFYGLCLYMGYAPDLSLLNADTVNFLVDGVAQYPDKDYKPSDLPKIADAVKAAYADLSDKKLTEVAAPAFGKNTEPGMITVEQVAPPASLRFPDLKKLPDGRLVAVYSEGPTHGVDVSNPIWYSQSVRFAVSSDNGETWSNYKLFDLEKLVELKAPELEGVYERYELQKTNPGSVYVVGGMCNDCELFPVKMDLNNDGKMEDALLFSGSLGNMKSDGSMRTHRIISWIAVDDLNDWLAGKPGKDWSEFQLVVNDHQRGDPIQFDDGAMLFPIYGSNRVRVLEMTFNPELQKWEWGKEREVPNLAPDGDWTTSRDAFNEFSLMTPDGTDKVVYGFVRSSGVVYATYDRGYTWELVANEPGSVQQPQFARIDTNRAFVTWADEGYVRPTMGKVFYYDAGWDETETRFIYETPRQIGQDAADPSCVYTDEGTVLTIQYDTGYLSIIGVKDDPNSEEFLPNTLTTKQLSTVASADSVTLGNWVADKKPEKSFLMEFDLTLNSDSTVVQALTRTDVGVKFSAKGVTCLEGTCVQNTALTAGTKYSVKIGAVGKMVWGKIWVAGTAEPGWSVWCTDHVNQSLTTAASLSATGSATVENVAVKIAAMLEMEQSITALSSDFPRAIQYDRYNTEGTMVWSSSNPDVASVDQEGVLTFNAAGETTITVTLGELTRTVQVTVNPAPAELTGVGEKKIFQTEDFSSYPVGENSFYAYLGADKAFSTTSPSSEPGSGYSIVEENGNKFLRLYDDSKTKSPWVMSNTKVTGNYTVQFDFRTFGSGGTSLYVNMFQKDALNGAHPNTALFRLHEFAGIQIAEGAYFGRVPCDQWGTAKMMCINGALYCKVWPKHEEEPEMWSSIVQIPGMITATANHVRMQVYHPSSNAEERGHENEYFFDIDNLVISQQQVEGIEAMRDVIPGAWYYNAVNYVLNNKIMSGYNATTFGTNDTLTRAMVVQVLYNKEGQPNLNGAKHSFKDVPADQWFNNAVTWGSNKGVVSGYGGGVFKPNDAVTIEQVAVILHNYSGKPAGNGDIAKLGACSDWAQPALKWAVEQGLFKGMEYTSVTASATRAQTAQMLANFLRGN